MAVDISGVKDRPLENFRKLPDIFNAAVTRHMSVSAYLETLDPTDDWSGEDKHMDAYERSLSAAGVFTRSDVALGTTASPFSVFFSDRAARVAGMEYIRRTWNSAKFGESQSTRFLLASALQTVTVGARPYIEAATIEAERDALDLPLQALIARETRINTASYRAVRLDETNSMTSGSKASEGGELPRAKLALTDGEARMQKWGNAIEWTYEAEENAPIDIIGFFIRQLAIQAEYDKLEDALDVMMSDPLVVVDRLQDLDRNAFGASPTVGDQGKLTMRAILAENGKFKRGPRMNTMLADDTVILDFLMTPVGGSAGRSLAEMGTTPIGQLSPLGTRDTAGFQYSGIANAPDGKAVFLDRTSAMERISRIGGDISETANEITSQVRKLTMSEYEAFHVVRPSAIRIVDLKWSTP